MLANVCAEKMVWRRSPVLFSPTTSPYPIIGVDPMPCSVAMSLRRVDASPAARIVCPAPIEAIPTRVARTRFRVCISKNLVQYADQPSGIEVVLHQAATEVADAQLSNRCRQHGIVGTDIGNANDAAQH